MNFRTFPLVLLLVLAILYVLTMPPSRYPFVCVPTCLCDFRSQRGLSIHQAACPLHMQEENQAWQALAAAAEAHEKYPLEAGLPLMPPPPVQAVRQ